MSRKKTTPAIHEGDVYQIPLPDGRYGAVRVLRTGGRFDFSPNLFHLLAVTTYLDTKEPTLDDPRLLDVLHEKRFFFNNQPCVFIYSGNFSTACTCIGTLPLCPSEQRYAVEIGDGRDGGFPLCGKIPDTIGHNILLEWRWEHDRDAMIAEVEEARKAREIAAQRPKKPKKRMDDALFWEIIALFDWSKQGNDDAVMEPAIQKLAALPVVDIRACEEALAYKLWLLDTKEHAQQIGEFSYNEQEDFFSVDSFLYARCAAVVNGKVFYERALKNPKKMPKDLEFESVLSLCALAYERKTGREFDYRTSTDYETYANRKGWA